MKLFTFSVSLMLVANGCFAQAFSPAAMALTSRSVRIASPEVSGSSTWGHGMRLNNHQILTAAHVVDGLPQDVTLTVSNAVGIHIGRAKVSFVGDKKVNDLAILDFVPINQFVKSVDAVQVCKEDVKPGEALLVPFENEIVTTHASSDSPFVSYTGGQEYSRATQAFFSRGVSGAGVYSAQRLCLAGIISKQFSSGLSTNDGKACLDTLAGGEVTKACGAHFGTDFVPAETIRQFLAW